MVVSGDQDLWSTGGIFRNAANNSVIQLIFQRMENKMGPLIHPTSSKESYRIEYNIHGGNSNVAAC